MREERRGLGSGRAPEGEKDGWRLAKAYSIRNWFRDSEGRCGTDLPRVNAKGKALVSPQTHERGYARSWMILACRWRIPRRGPCADP